MIALGGVVGGKDKVLFHRTQVDAIAVGGGLSRGTFVY
jgi:hypothetical protein